MKLKQNSTYIFKQKHTSYPTVFKGKVLELTNTTIYLKDLDSDIKYREILSTFNNKWEIIEDFQDLEIIGKYFYLLDEFQYSKNSPISIIKPYRLNNEY